MSLALNNLAQEEAPILKGQANWNSVGENISKQKDIILRNSGTISVLGHSQSTGTENFLMVQKGWQWYPRESVCVLLKSLLTSLHETV